jgi:hypothetical protein
MLHIGIDLVGPLTADPDGNVWILNAVETKYGIGAAEPSKTKENKELLPKVKQIVNRVMELCKVKDKVNLRLHSDLDQSLLAEIRQWVVGFGGKRTTTEGYDHDGNSRIESRNAKMKQAMRVMLLDSAGGNRQYEELSIPASLLAVQGFNHLPEAGDKSPLERCTGKASDITKHQHIFGSLVYYYQAEERRQGAADMPTKLAVYGRPDQNVSGGHCIYPVQWNVATKMWEIQPHIVRKSIIVSNGEFVLLESKDGRSKDGKKFDAMLDKFDTTASAGEVYVVDKIHNHKTVGNTKQYLCSWKGYSKKQNSWEPTKHLADYGAHGLLIEYLESLKRKAAGRMASTDQLSIWQHCS